MRQRLGDSRHGKNDKRQSDKDQAIDRVAEVEAGLRGHMFARPHVCEAQLYDYRVAKEIPTGAGDSTTGDSNARQQCQTVEAV